MRSNLRELATLASVRSWLASSIGQTAYKQAREYYTVLGYKQNLTFDDYMQRYDRQDIAARIVDLPPADTWKKPPQVSEDDDLNTPFVQAWLSLVDRLRVFGHLSRVDKLSGIGEYGALLIGMKSNGDLSEPAIAGSLSGPNDITYLKPFSENSAAISTFDEESTSIRYGFPLSYTLSIGSGSKEAHWSRVIHVAEGKLDFDVFGTPRLKQVFNLLDDLMKVVGGGAEATWLNMRPGLAITNRADYQIPQDDDSKDTRQDEIEEYLHGIARILMMEGVDVTAFSGQTVDPSGIFTIIISLISSATSIPQRVLLGSASGELSAAEEDTKQWFGYINSRQQNYAEPEILRPFIDRLIWLGALPRPANGYDIGTLDADGERRWPALFELSEGDKSSITLDKANSVKALTDPLTMEFPITKDEQRELLGYPMQEDKITGLAINSIAQYEQGIRSAVRGLWNGSLNAFDFAFALGATIRQGIVRAWLEGARKAGLVGDVELTAEEMDKRQEIISEQVAHVDNFGDHIEANNKESGGKLKAFNARIALWVGAYTEAVNTAMSMARNDPKLKFVLGPTKQHCNTCLKLSDKVKRASQWAAADVGPQSHNLECVKNAGGITSVCKCFFVQTDEPMSKGPLPKG